MAQFIIPAIAALPSLIGGIMSLVNSGKKLSGGQLMMLHRLSHHPRHGGKIMTILRKYHRLHPHRAYHRRKMHKRRKGRGVVADVAGSIPLLGSILGPIIRAFGGKIRHRRRGHGLAPMYYARPYAGMGLRRRKYHKHKKLHKKHHGHGLSPMYYARPYSGMGLLAPIGSRMLLKGRGLLAPAGGYMPYAWRGGTIRKGHLRKIPGRRARVRVRPALIAYGKKKRS